jgi:predicted DNA-binding antitoxin AbrB/MazE fold protein
MDMTATAIYEDGVLKLLTPLTLPENTRVRILIEPATEESPIPPLRIVKLGGILEGYDFSPELLAEARREMWRKYHEDSLS